MPWLARTSGGSGGGTHLAEMAVVGLEDWLRHTAQEPVEEGYYLLVGHTCTHGDNGVPIGLFGRFDAHLQTCFDVLAVRYEVQT